MIAIAGGSSATLSFGHAGKTNYSTQLVRNMAIAFPVAPSIGDLYPPDPGVSGVTQYIWQGDRWDAVLSAVSLGTSNQGAYNTYQWPSTDGVIGTQLTTDGAGNLIWDVPAAPSMQLLQLDRPFNGDSTTGVAFTLYEAGTTTPFAPNPVTNILVFLGGVPQIYGAAFSIGGSTITFTEAPLAGTTFYSISNVIA